MPAVSFLHAGIRLGNHRQVALVLLVAVRDGHLEQILIYGLDLICVQALALDEEPRHEERIVSSDLVACVLELHLVVRKIRCMLVINLTDITELLSKVYRVIVQVDFNVAAVRCALLLDLQRVLSIRLRVESV